MKQFLVGILLFFSAMRVTTAQLLFKENGAAAFTKSGHLAPDTATRFSIDITELKVFQDKSVRKFIAGLKNNLETTIDFMHDHPAPLSLTKKLLDADTTKLLQMLQSILDSADKMNFTRATADAQLLPLVGAIVDVYKSPLFHITFSATDDQQTYTLTQDDITSKFLSSYYSATLGKPYNKRVERTTLSDYYSYYMELKPQYDTILVLMRRITAQAKPETIEQLYLAHLNFEHYYRNSRFITLLQSPFYKQWLWSTGGTIKLNPLDFTAAGLLDTVPALDLLSKTFTREEFLTRNKRLTEENAKNLQKLLFPSQVTNRVDFPVGEMGRDQYFLLNSKEKNLEMKNIRVLDEGEKIYVGILNVDKGYRVRSRVTDTESLSGLSATEEIIDTAARGLLSLFNLLNPQTAAIGRIAGNLNRGANNAVPIPILIDPNVVRVADVVSTPDNKNLKFFNYRIVLPHYDTATFWNATKRTLDTLIPQIVRGDNSDLSFYDLPAVSSITFNNRIFEILKRKYRKEVMDSLATNSAQKIENIQAKIISDYLGKMYAQQVAPIVTGILQTDSFYIVRLIDVLSGSSLPVRRIQSETDTVPKFRSEQLIIEDKRKNIQQTVQIDRINNSGPPKDSSQIVSFRYKKGARSLVEVSFGLGYTFQNVRVQRVDKNRITSKDERFRGVAALHFYPFRGKNKTRQGLYKIDEPFFGSWNRINFMIGAGIPRPLDNYFLGVGYDLGPGLKLNTGVHVHKYRQYTMRNDSITGDESTYKILQPYVSLGLNPELVVKNILAVF